MMSKVRTMSKPRKSAPDPVGRAVAGVKATVPTSEAAPADRREEPTPPAMIHPVPQLTPAAPAGPQAAYQEQVGRTRWPNDRELSLF
jgi:hypothetical protein